jgi:hypothetical protein
MDKLERYLDQVCRGIGGPREMRVHVRQELREHLLDAAARHKAAGLPEDRALEQAIADFGRPDEVRSELEQAHGHRLLGVVIDKALDWKEKTMRAKWLWATWAHLALAVVIVLEVLFITFNVVFLVPKFKKLMQDGIIDSTVVGQQGISWMPTYLNRLSHVGGQYATPLLIGAIAAIILFEWRVRSENKSLIRMSLWGTVAVGLFLVGAVQAGSLVIPFEVAAPTLGKMTRPWVAQQITTISSSADKLDKALPTKDWTELQTPAKQASEALSNLTAGPAMPSLTKWNEQPTADELRAALRTATDRWVDVQEAVAAKSEVRLKAALERFREAFEPITAAARRVK